MRVLHCKAVAAIQIDCWRLWVERQTLLQSVLKHGFTFRNSLSRVFLDLIGRVPLHAKQALNRIRACLFPDLVLNLLADRAHLRLRLVAAALAFARLTVSVVVAVGAELRQCRLLVQTRNQVVLRDWALFNSILLVREFSSGELRLTNHAALAVVEEGRKVHLALKTVRA